MTAMLWVLFISIGGLMVEVVDFIAHAFCIVGLCKWYKGDTLAVKGTWCDVKLHCRETGNIFQWAKHTEKTPRVWFRLEKIWRR
ncbi:hypothetical protein TUST1-10_01040 [Vibrio phage ICP1_2004_A]|jgi:hypothetical protein|nr:hypothetical protein TUST1-159_01035 [Vibrio phage ICP1_2006_B]ADX88933.1 hypothetical protein TUST1-17_01035 [Vibrio phage ICP1_2006_A]ADX89163.1 hypothetical protein TUST1-15_01055 [Vibrio phage ICP1_2005_A]ADX89393.1 hypothetical protein TUST1-2_01065 [Vibrio phage ICP1_2001_A]ADX89620.1 hypothetical protein TUST1-10_01040 [Vibrio phage ICP1_2004_A]